ncbi:MAG: hypothetical protein ACYSR9_01310 [Planctomycetota bacterium]|jgi:hypothetical protein
MIENEQLSDKKKTRLVRRIFKWIGLGLLVLLIITAVIFKAPWKVTTLLAVILAACTALPKPFRKWFLLLVSVVLIALIVWIFMPEDNEDWRPFTFDKEIAALEAEYSIPDEENAAIIYNELLQEFDPRKMGLKFLRPGIRELVLSEPWVSADHPDLVQWLHGHENAIRILPQACRIKTCRFTSNYKLTVTDKLKLNRYTALKSWVVLLLLSGNNDIAEGRLDQSLLKYLCVLRMADHLYQQKRITDFLMSFGIEGLALWPINRLVIEEQLNDKQLRIISDNLTNLENNWSSDFLQCLEYDKLFVKNTFCSLMFEKDSKGSVRYSRNPADAIWGHFRLGKLEETYWQRKSMKAYAILAWFALPPTPQNATEMVEKIYEECHAMAKSSYAWDKETIGPPPSLELNCRFLIWSLTNRISRHYGGFHDIYLKRLAQRRGLRLLIEIKQYQNKHGTWPAGLEVIQSRVPPRALLDPVSDSAFVYVLDGDSFRLYSKGINRIDEGGKRDYIRALDKYKDDIAIWPLPEQ